MLNYVSVYDLNADIVNSLHKIPRDIDLVVGVPRSGMLVASLIALYLNKPLSDIDSYSKGNVFSFGFTKKVQSPRLENATVLIVEDSVYTGKSINNAKEKIKNINNKHIFYAAYVSPDNNADSFVDIYAKKIGNRVFEWNIMHHPRIKNMCLDIDGILCCDPSKEQNDDGEKYKTFLLNATP